MSVPRLAAIASFACVVEEPATELPRLRAPDGPGSAHRGDVKSTWVDHAGLILLMLTAGALLLRPADLVEPLDGAPLYKILIIACLLLSVPRLLERISMRALRENAILSLLMFLVPAVGLSHLIHANLYEARHGTILIGKALLFFLLVVALVDTLGKLKAILFAVAASVFLMTALAVLQYHGVLHLSGLRNIEQRAMSSEGPTLLVRLCGIGVFNDPNDYSLILVVSAVICASALGDRRSRRARWWLLAPLLLFGYALLLTHSRSGLVSATAAMVSFLWARLGWRHAVPLACLLAAVLLGMYWCWQTDLRLDEPQNTFQTRIELWNSSLVALRSSPVFGIGQGKLYDTITHVAHNSYLHAFAELGLLGGTAFIGAFYLLLRSVWRTASDNHELARMRPFVLAMTTGYATGLLALSRCYAVPTQLVLGLGMVYVALASRDGPGVIPTLDWSNIRRVAAVGAIFLVSTYSFVSAVLSLGRS